jgi:hypothetical protein
MSSKWQDAALAVVAVLLLAAGLWANTDGNAVQQSRGAWAVHAMR